MDKKYKFTGETKTSEDGVSVIQRIQALKDFGMVVAGELGGWIEKEENLSHINDCWVSGDAEVSDDAWVYGDARIYNKAQVEASSDVIVITNIGSRNGTTTFYRNQHGGISVVCGCFEGTLEEFEKAVSEKHGDNKHGRVYRLAIETAKEQIELD